MIIDGFSHNLGAIAGGIIFLGLVQVSIIYNYMRPGFRIYVDLIIERAKRAHSLFMSIEISDIYIYIYVRVVRVSCVPFSPYTKETPLGIIL